MRGNQIPVIVAVVCRAGEPWNPTFRLIDMDCSGPNGLVLSDHPRRAAWEGESDGHLEVYLLDAPASQGFSETSRRALIADICSKVVPPHGQIPLSGG